MAWVTIADEYHMDGSLTDYPEHAKHAPAIFQKADEGMGSPPNNQWYPGASKKARDAGLKCGAYFWILIADDGVGQARQFLKTAPAADFYAVDLEAADGNAPHAKPQILSCFHAFVDQFHASMGTKPLLLYGASFMGDKGIAWSELVEDRDWILAWIPRYDTRPTDIRNWPRADVVDYAALDRYQVPQDKLAMVQFTDGKSGPPPHTLPGLNRAEDLSVLLLPLETLMGQAPAQPAQPAPPAQPAVAVPATPADTFVLRKPNGAFSKALGLDEAMASARDLLSQAAPGESVEIRKREPA